MPGGGILVILLSVAAVACNDLRDMSVAVSVVSNFKVI